MSDEIYEIPGSIKVNISIELHTLQATRLFHGREKNTDTNKPEIFGVPSFERRTKLMMYASHMNDPFADWYLLQIDNNLQSLSDFLDKKKNQISKFFDKSSLNIDTGTSVKPIVLNVSYSSAYANKIIDVLKSIDNHILDILVLKHIGLMKSDEVNIHINNIMHAFRSFLTKSTRGFHYTKVTRKDIENKTALYETAQTLMSHVTLTPEIINEETRAEFAPNIRITLDDLTKGGPVRRRVRNTAKRNAT